MKSKPCKSIAAIRNDVRGRLHQLESHKSPWLDHAARSEGKIAVYRWLLTELRKVQDYEAKKVDKTVKRLRRENERLRERVERLKAKAGAY